MCIKPIFTVNITQEKAYLFLIFASLSLCLYKLFRILKIKKLLILQNDLCRLNRLIKTFKITHIQATVSQSSMFSVHYLEKLTSNQVDIIEMT